ncbi:hypothetical protein F383_33145 [Gossypium arboreum]|jgi:hypothetical protein
MLHTA